MNKKTLLHNIASCGNDAKTLADNFEQIVLIHQCGAPMDAAQTHIIEQLRVIERIYANIHADVSLSASVDAMLQASSPALKVVNQ